MTTLRLLILGLLLLSFGSVQAQADTVNRKKHIVKFNYNLVLSCLTSNFEGDVLNSDAPQITLERQIKELSITNFLTLSYVKRTKKSNLFELELRKIELDRIKPTIESDTIRSKRDSFTSSFGIRSSMNYNILSSANNFLTVGLFLNTNNTSNRDNLTDFRYNQLQFDIGPIIKYAHINSRNMYIETHLAANAFRYEWERLKNNPIAPFGNVIEYRNSFYDFFSKTGSIGVAKSLDVGFSLGYNF